MDVDFVNHLLGIEPVPVPTIVAASIALWILKIAWQRYCKACFKGWRRVEVCVIEGSVIYDEPGAELDIDEPRLDEINLSGPRQNAYKALVCQRCGDKLPLAKTQPPFSTS